MSSLCSRPLPRRKLSAPSLSSVFQVGLRLDRMGGPKGGQTLDVAATSCSDGANFNTPWGNEIFQRILPSLEESSTLKSKFRYFITGPSPSQFKQQRQPFTLSWPSARGQCLW